MRKIALTRQLAVVAGFETPQAGLEQYSTPPELAAHLIHVADLMGDIDSRTVIDLGTGTGMLALGAALRGPSQVIGLDLDRDALGIARKNRRRVGTATPIAWVRGDATRAPLEPHMTADRSNRSIDSSDRTTGDPGSAAEPMDTSPDPVTVVMNPPFGAQSGNEHADRGFLETTAEIAAVSYSVHNRNSQEFVESFVADNGGAVSRAFGAEIDLPRQFEFHGKATRTINVEVFRIVWSN